MVRPINAPPHVYAGAGFARAAERRKDAAWLEEKRRHSDSELVILRGTRLQVAERGDGLKLVRWTVAEMGGEITAEASFLGEDEGRAVFALLGDDQEDETAFELREIGPRLTRTDAGLAAYARGLAHWHNSHRFCPICGGATEIVDAGHGRRCKACGRPQFPRTDPAVIMLVTHGEHCLLARNPRFPKGMYSTLAGFVEPGESLEEAVAREVLEEVGIAITDTTYRSSQPWPFPASLMVGFRARALERELTVDPEELADAGWYERRVLLDEARRPIILPRPDSIARFLVEEWLLEGD
ncbi:MAG: NAD(+) diphosphatase [Geminicoccaceae bacterium]